MTHPPSPLFSSAPHAPRPTWRAYHPPPPRHAPPPPAPSLSDPLHLLLQVRVALEHHPLAVMPRTVALGVLLQACLGQEVQCSTWEDCRQYTTAQYSGCRQPKQRLEGCTRMQWGQRGGCSSGPVGGLVMHRFHDYSGGGTGMDGGSQVQVENARHGTYSAGMDGWWCTEQD